MHLKDSKLFRQQCYLDGEWADANSAATFEVTNPADGSVLGSVPAMGLAETHRAIDAAEAAFPAWSAKLAKERSAIVRRWSELIAENQEDLATILTSEQGKPMAESRAEIAGSAAMVEWFAEEGKRIYGDTIPQPVDGRRILVLKQPVGVVAAITPWNFPASLVVRKCAPALAAGCTVIVRPASQTPFTAFALAELATRAGLPKGTFHVITGPSSEVGHELTGNPKVRKLSFTGSTEVGKILIRESAETVKKVSMELGGNAPFIVFDDANLDDAVDGAIASKFRNTGQTCVCANRIFVQAAVYDEFLSRFAQATSGLRVGPGLNGGSDQGPLIDIESLENVEAMVTDAIEKGARIVTGGKRHALGGSFFEPTILADVNGNMRVTHEEIFGPVAPVYRFESEDDVIHSANDTQYGLAAYVYSRDLGRVWRVSEALEFGIVGVNAGITATEVAPFGGMKESGIGREGSKYGIDEYVEMKYVAVAGLER